MVRGLQSRAGTGHGVHQEGDGFFACIAFGCPDNSRIRFSGRVRITGWGRARNSQERGTKVRNEPERGVRMQLRLVGTTLLM